MVQVGDDIMVYLLKHTSIFLLRPHKMHHQVAGPPITDLCFGFSKHVSESEHQKPSLTYLGNQDMRFIFLLEFRLHVLGHHIYLFIYC